MNILLSWVGPADFDYIKKNERNLGPIAELVNSYNLKNKNFDKIHLLLDRDVQNKAKEKRSVQDLVKWIQAADNSALVTFNQSLNDPFNLKECYEVFEREFNKIKEENPLANYFFFLEPGTKIQVSALFFCRISSGSAQLLQSGEAIDFNS